MIFAPTLGIRDTHLVAEHIPHHSRLLTCAERVDRRHTAKAIKHLITRQRSTVAASEHFLKQLPKFTFLHATQCTQT